MSHSHHMETSVKKLLEKDERWGNENEKNANKTESDQFN